MDITTKQMLSSALQDLARGLKKLRTVVDRQTFVNSVTNVSESGDKKSPDENSGDKKSPDENSGDKKIPGN